MTQRRTRGVTLIEVLVVMSVFILILTMVARAIVMSLHATIATQDKVQAKREAVLALDLLKRDLMTSARMNNPNPQVGTVGLTPTSAAPLSFYRNTPTGQIVVNYWYEPTTKEIKRAINSQPERILARNIESFTINQGAGSYVFSANVKVPGVQSVISSSAGVLQL